MIIGTSLFGSSQYDDMEIKAPNELSVRVHNKFQPNAVSRKSKNAAFVIMGFWRKTGRRGRIQALKQKVKQRKRMFGIEYMDMYDKGADTPTLDRCVQKARLEIDSLMGGVTRLRDELASIESETQSKIIRIETQTHTTPSLTISPTSEQPLYPADIGMQDDPASTHAFASDVKLQGSYQKA